jgi:hypothetical protein
MPVPSGDNLQVINANTGSPLIDYSSNTPASRNYYSYALMAFVVVLLMYLAWTSYSCFYENQELLTEPFLTGTIKSSPDDDISFDMIDEVNKLREIQEDYLNTIRTDNN